MSQRRPPVTSEEFPTGVDGLTPEWLGAVLRDAEILSPGTDLQSLDCSVAGRGFAGDVLRVSLAYGTRDAGPVTVIAKFADQGSPGLQRFPGKLSREAGFYQDIGSDCGLKVPDCYFLGHRPIDGAFLSIMEDVGEGRRGIPGREYVPEEWAPIFTALATMHARWWESPDLGSFPWLRQYEQHVGEIASLLSEWRDRFLSRWSARLPSELRELFRQLPALWHRAGDHLSRSPRTLAHGDANVGNFIFSTTPQGSVLTVIDWQDVMAGPASTDVAIPLQSVPADEREEALAIYVRTLHNLGVDCPSFQIAADLSVAHLRSATVAMGRGVLGTEEGDALCERLIGSRREFWIEAASVLERRD